MTKFSLRPRNQTPLRNTLIGIYCNIIGCIMMPLREASYHTFKHHNQLHIADHAKFLWCYPFENFVGTMIVSARNCMAGSPMRLIGRKVIENFLLVNEMLVRNHIRSQFICLDDDWQFICFDYRNFSSGWITAWLGRMLQSLAWEPPIVGVTINIMPGLGVHPSRAFGWDRTHHGQ